MKKLLVLALALILALGCVSALAAVSYTHLSAGRWICPRRLRR